MSVSGVFVAAVLVLAGACGDAGRDENAGGDRRPSGRFTSESTSSTTANGATSPGLTAVPEVQDPAGSPAAPPTSASRTSSDGGKTARPGEGLIHGTVERECSSNPGAGGGCYNQAGGVAGTTVELRSTTGDVLARATTARDGTFQFTVAPGRYVIRHASSGVFQERDVVAGRTTFVSLVVP